MKFRTMLFREPQTQRERRWAQTVEPDEPAPRPRRRGTWLPSDRRDLSRSDYQHRSWKRHRTTQHKESKP